MRKNVTSINFLSISSVLFCLILIVSCTQDESIYSCNPEIESWVKENKKTIETMSIDEFLRLERDYQKASYIAFSKKQKENLWITKITKTLKLEWRENEQEHLGKLLTALKEYSNVFSKDCPEEYKDEFKVWVYQWVKYGEEEFSWSPKLIKNLLFSPNYLLNKDGDIEEGRIKLTKQIKTRSEDEDRRNCNCDAAHLGEGIVWDDCSEDSYCVEGYWNCKPKVAGCGLFFMDRCDGYCW